jgi:hypothetical protein
MSEWRQNGKPKYRANPLKSFLERVKGIEPSYSAWKSANFRNVFKSRSDISQLFGRLRSLRNFSLSEWRLPPKRSFLQLSNCDAQISHSIPHLHVWSRHRPREPHSRQAFEAHPPEQTTQMPSAPGRQGRIGRRRLRGVSTAIRVPCSTTSPTKGLRMLR